MPGRMKPEQVAGQTEIRSQAEYFDSLAEISILSARVRSFKRVIFQGKDLNV
nr:hypothetical protein pKpnJMC_00056 [Klebsiella pneumoniae]UHA81061.1 hypothetical protein pKpnC6_00093 [Klebsiella pneumoniae]